MQRIIICCDGTWNKPGMKDRGEIVFTNVQKFHDALADTDALNCKQNKFYLPGVGTGNFINSILGGAFGDGININIKEAYRCIMQTYEKGDEIYLLGFSRGAYTARSVAGMIRNSGILKPGKHDLLEDAFTHYRSRDTTEHPDSPAMKKFRQQNSVEDITRIKFIGVWDTVGALGVPVRALNNFNTDTLNVQFHDLKLSSYTLNAFHALAIDERREIFKAALWEQTEKARRQNKGMQRLEQVWFSGSHSNVGGGYIDARPSDISLRWMIERAKECGLEFNEDYIYANISFDDEKCEGEMRNSKTSIFKIYRDYIRPIGKAVNGCEDIHISAINRKEKIETYNPENMVRALVNKGLRKMNGHSEY